METTSSIVTIQDFASSHLQNRRNLYLYLPPSYASNPERRYPVLYMQDGQNLFHPSQMSGVAWDVHHVADRLIAAGHMQEILIVGVASTEQRINEYTRVPGVGEYAVHENRGALYEQFLVEEVKPFVDANYRTLAGREHTAIIGASLGALASFYTLLRYPEVFGKIGMISSSFWWGDRSVLRELQSQTPAFSQKWPLQIWVDTGDQEVDDVPNYMVEDAKQVAAAFENLGYRAGEQVRLYIDKGGQHSEVAWQKRVHLPLQFFFGREE